MTLVGKGGGGVELEPAGAQEPELAGEIPFGKQLHGLEEGSQASGRNDMHDGTVMAGHSDKRAGLGGANGRRGPALEVPDAVCILHAKKVHFRRTPVKAPARGRRQFARCLAAFGRTSRKAPSPSP